MSGWKDLCDDLKRRSRQPCSHPTFVFFFLSSVVIIGGIGIWLEFVFLYNSDWKDPTNLKSALATFFPALIGSTCLQLLLQDTSKALKAISIFFMIIFFLLGVWLIADRNLSNWFTFSAGGFGSLMSLWYWWIANADNADFYDVPRPTAAVGGEDTESPLDGSLTGFSS
ncbi:hypothetical protein [Novacetimonas hansenii]|uniref:hypothetical protein n=1 Tax=Novacetimonas hansenii TaxID=436 RepID=UPI00094F6CEA|nr:hypothetical protein [Novacetimonas hansenii]